MGSVLVAPAGTELEAGVGYTTEIAIVNSGCGGNQPLNNWDVSNVTDMGGMFMYASSFNQPLNKWNVSKVKYMYDMFYDARKQRVVTKYGEIRNWDVSNVTNMESMFDAARSFNQPLNNWNVALREEPLQDRESRRGDVAPLHQRREPLRPAQRPRDNEVLV